MKEIVAHAMEIAQNTLDILCDNTIQGLIGIIMWFSDDIVKGNMKHDIHHDA